MKKLTICGVSMLIFVLLCLTIITFPPIIITKVMLAIVLLVIAFLFVEIIYTLCKGDF